jgi:hypothetical protein
MCWTNNVISAYLYLQLASYSIESTSSFTSQPVLGEYIGAEREHAKGGLGIVDGSELQLNIDNC